jgi:N-methylhydantoinase A/oxoprolinase/acetone carboxylase beta subunit
MPTPSDILITGLGVVSPLGVGLENFWKALAAGQSGFLDAAVYDRAAMGEGFAFAGPAIVEQADTTTLVEPGWTGTVDAAGNLLLTWQAG